MNNLKFSELKKELQNKMRTVKDLARYIDKKRELHPNYSIFLGSGASVTSGIKSGGQLVNEWRREIYEQTSEKPYLISIEDANKTLSEEDALKQAVQYLIHEQGSWYNPLNEYSSLFERKFDLPSQRRRFVEKLVDEKLPSIGYLYLISLINEGYFNTIFTTNFDDLINEAFYQFSNIRPHVCAHDSSIGSLSVLSNRPKIIKLHGDYLFDDIKNTLRETESLETNTKEKFIEFSKESGLIIVGYSGQDRSVMDVINYLLQQEEYLKNGLYWCFRKDDEIPHEIRKILWRDKVYCIEIEGYDQFLADIFLQLNCKLSLTDKDFHSKRDKCIKSFIEDNFNLNTSEAISMHIDEMKALNRRQDISKFLQQIKETDLNQLDQIEFKSMLEIETLIKERKFDEVDKKIDLKLMEKLNPDLKENYFKLKLKSYKMAGETKKAIDFIDELIRTDPFNQKLLTWKLDFLEALKEQIYTVKDFCDKNQYSYTIRNKLVRLLLEYNESRNKWHETITLENSLDIINDSLKINSSLDNSAYTLKLKILDQINKKKLKTSLKPSEKDKLNQPLKDLIKSAESINPIHLQFLELKKLFALITLDPSDINNYIQACTFTNSYVNNKLQINLLEKQVAFYNTLLLHKDFNDIETTNNIEKFFLHAGNYPHANTNMIFIIGKVDFLIDNKRDLGQGIEILYDLLENVESYSYILSIINRICYDNSSNNLSRIKVKLESIKNLIDHEDYLICYCYITDAENKTLDALKFFIEFFEIQTNKQNHLIKYTYFLLKAEKYDEVIKLYEDNKSLIRELSHENQVVLSINLICAEKAKYQVLSESNKSLLNQYRSSKPTPSIFICALALLEDNQAFHHMKERIYKEFSAYYELRSWPAMSEKFKKLLDQEFQNITVDPISKLAS
ncbi:SIR2 family protein [Alkanindiges illinoisensis]|uniref:SIR2 family protein n=1 Tax=Alkanindiges illinoisensis TaxID=197183 RepID=UPI0006882BF5|nr:SIR2 family protein [Alkanindiges illinoisensis]